MKKPLRTFILFLAACSGFLGTLSSSENSGSSSQVEIRTLTVQEAVRIALSRSPDILVAEAQEVRAREALRESRSLNRPRVFAGTGLAYNNGMPLSIEGSAPSIFQISASQPFLSKKNSNLIREAEESGKAGKFGIESARNEIASRTASVYYELHQARKVVALASAKLDAVQKQQIHIETLLEAGKVRPVEVSLIKTATLSARQQLLIAQEQAIIAEKELQELTGVSDTAGIRTVEPQIDSPLFEMPEDEIYRQALQNAPEIQRAEADIRARDFHVEAERGDYLPKMEIVTQYALLSRSNNYDDYFRRFERNNFLLGLSIQVPVFNGSTGARVAQSRQEASEARYKLERLKSDLRLNIQRGLGALRIARGAVDLGRIDLEAAREMLQINEALMAAGRMNEKDVEDLRAQTLQKELALLESDQALFQRKLEMLYAAGIVAAAIQ